MPVPDVSISPHFGADKLDAPDTEDLVDVFEDRIVFWVLAPSKELLRTEFGGLAAFALLLSYFEGFWAYSTGQTSKGHSKEFFVEGFVDVFRRSRLPEVALRTVADALYVDARCGFFHDGMYRGRMYFAATGHDLLITLPRENGVINLLGQVQSVVVDPARCVAAVETHLSSFTSRLRNPANSSQRNRFVRAFRAMCDWTAPGPVVGI
jgi:hypothetical protein